MSPAGLPRLPSVQSDQRLVALAREGDARAFEAIGIAPATAEAQASPRPSVATPGEKAQWPSRLAPSDAGRGASRSRGGGRSALASLGGSRRIADGEHGVVHASGQGSRDGSGREGSFLLSGDGESLRAASGSTSTASGRDGGAGSAPAPPDGFSTAGAGSAGQDGEVGDRHRSNLSRVPPQGPAKTASMQRPDRLPRPALGTSQRGSRGATIRLVVAK
jgi:hypothetical protein